MRQKPRKIAYILAPIEFGGAERVSLSFLLHYKRADTVVYPIILCRPWEKENTFTEALQKESIAFSLVPIIKRPRQEGRDYVRFFRLTLLIFKELRKAQVDLVHTNGYLADTFGLIAAKILRIPTVTTCHGFISITRKYRLYNKLQIIAFRFMNRVIAVSEKLKNDLLNKKITADKIRIVHNAVQSQHHGKLSVNQRQSIRKQHQIEDQELVLGYVGRLSAEKGLKFLIEAGSQLLKANIPIRIFVIGDGPQASEIKEFVRDNQLVANVTFAGFQKNVGDFLSAFDIFVLPSLTEGTSMALLEAMACGLPVIATAVGGTPKVITSEKNGLLVPSASPLAIVEAVKRLYSDQQLSTRIGQEALHTINSRFSISGWLDKIDSIYTEVLAEKSQ